MAIDLRCFRYPAVIVGANAGRASVTPCGLATSPLAVVDGRAAANGAVREVTARFRSPRFPRNVSLRCGTMGRAIMTVSAQVVATGAVRCRVHVAGGRVARAGFGRVVRADAALIPNPAFERTRRFSASTWQASARRAAQLDRWAPWFANPMNKCRRPRKAGAKALDLAWCDSESWHMLREVAAGHVASAMGVVHCSPPRSRRVLQRSLRCTVGRAARPIDAALVLQGVRLGWWWRALAGLTVARWARVHCRVVRMAASSRNVARGTAWWQSSHGRVGRGAALRASRHRRAVPIAASSRKTECHIASWR